MGFFYVQNDKSARHKDKKYKGVLLHSFAYYAAVFLVILPVFSLDMVLAATCSAAAHFVIDTLKYVFWVKKVIRKKEYLFVLDQCVHLISIFTLAYMMDAWNFSMGQAGIVNSILSMYGFRAETAARWVAAILLIHAPTNIFIQTFLEDYRPKGDGTIIKSDNKAGRRVGTVERLLMLIFLSADQYAAVGFVLTAKSIARYDKIAKDEKFAEYYLLGTLVSTLCVVACRMLVLP